MSILNISPQEVEKIIGKQVYPSSLHLYKKSLIGIAKDQEKKYLFQLAKSQPDLCRDFPATSSPYHGWVLQLTELSSEAAEFLRTYFPWTRPQSLRSYPTTIGCGDRLGVAGGGHLRACAKFCVAPVLAQQSMRELTLTQRTYQEVVDAATFHVFQQNWQQGYGADGDHLKNLSDIRQAIEAGCSMITLDQSDVIHSEFAFQSEIELEDHFSKLPSELQNYILDTYADRTFTLGSYHLYFPSLEAKRCALLYSDACTFAFQVYKYLKNQKQDNFDLELSIDETKTPTLPQHHFFIVHELQRQGIKIVAIAPKFIGDFQKGIDYRGNLEEFEKQFQEHCIIAQHCGRYRISIHSGSDKFSIFPIIGRYTHHYFHLKTAGTSWLEALKLIAIYDPYLFRNILQLALNNYTEPLKLYHITADFTQIISPEHVKDQDLFHYMEEPPSRQLLHICYGVILQHHELNQALFRFLHRYEDQYNESLDQHFSRHFQSLGIPLRSS